MSKLIIEHTDDYRLKVLKSSFYTLVSNDEDAQIIGAEMLHEVEKTYEIFEKIKEFKNIIQKEEEADNKNLSTLYDKARLYVSHYLQSLYNAIERGELPENTAEMYGFSFPFEIPDLSTEDKLLSVATALFESDDRRIGNGGKYFANPSIGSVKVWIEKFSEAYKVKKNVYNVKRGQIENIGSIREDSDKLILNLHKALDEKFFDYSTENKKLEFEKYGMSVEEEEIAELEHAEECHPKGGASNQLSFDLFF